MKIKSHDKTTRCLSFSSSQKQMLPRQVKWNRTHEKYSDKGSSCTTSQSKRHCEREVHIKNPIVRDFLHSLELGKYWLQEYCGHTCTQIGRCEQATVSISVSVYVSTAYWLYSFLVREVFFVPRLTSSVFDSKCHQVQNHTRRSWKVVRIKYIKCWDFFSSRTKTSLFNRNNNKQNDVYTIKIRMSEIFIRSSARNVKLFLPVGGTLSRAELRPFTCCLWLSSFTKYRPRHVSYSECLFLIFTSNWYLGLKDKATNYL